MMQTEYNLDADMAACAAREKRFQQRRRKVNTMNTVVEQTRCEFRDIERRQCQRSLDHSGFHDVYTSAQPATETQGQSWYEAKTGNHQGLIIEEGTGRNVAVTYDKADAATIVRAVSSHAQMIEALQRCDAIFRKGTERTSDVEWDEAYEAICTALAATD